MKLRKNTKRNDGNAVETRNIGRYSQSTDLSSVNKSKTTSKAMGKHAAKDATCVTLSASDSLIADAIYINQVRKIGIEKFLKKIS